MYGHFAWGLGWTLLLVVPLMLLACIAYLAPTLIAYQRHHKQAPAIAALNILLGGTGLGWALALVWALTTP